MEENEEKQKQKIQEEKKAEERVVRILSKDIEGRVKLYAGLTKIKGISWAISNAICKKLGLDKSRKIGSLTNKDIEKIEEFVKNMNIPEHMKNRKKDFESGENSHLIGTDLDLKKDFDIKRLKKIKSYRGVRHLAGQPTRGQRTRSHFRANRKKASGIKRKGGSAPPKKPGEFK